MYPLLLDHPEIRKSIETFFITSEYRYNYIYSKLPETATAEEQEKAYDEHVKMLRNKAEIKINEKVLNSLS